jgi:putative aminopeptidase FrvX
MFVRIDEVVKTKDDVLKLGITTGDFIFFDPKTIITESGYIKSRFLDDKISVAILFGLLKYLKEENITPKHNLVFIISTYEEVGHGASYIPEVDELIAVDMGCIGDDLSCTEQDVSICCKDSSGPYDYNIITKLVDIAQKNKLNFATDIYPYYGSDVSAAYRGGKDFRGALIGPGVHASHGMERTHIDAINSTLNLLIHYIQ